MMNASKLIAIGGPAITIGGSAVHFVGIAVKWVGVFHRPRLESLDERARFYGDRC